MQTSARPGRPGPGRGGARPGAGRPRDPRGPGPGGIPWTRVRHYARLGADRDTIIVALGLPAEQLRDPFVAHRLNEELDRGAAQYKLDLLEDIDTLRKGGDGSVNATLASLKETLGWAGSGGKPRAGGKPDNEVAAAEIERVLRRFRAPR